MSKVLRVRTRGGKLQAFIDPALFNDGEKLVMDGSNGFQSKPLLGQGAGFDHYIVAGKHHPVLVKQFESYCLHLSMIVVRTIQ